MTNKATAQSGDLIPREYVGGMRTFALMQSVFCIASGVVFSDGRAVLVHRSGRTEKHADIDHLTRDYVGTAGLVWDREDKEQEAVPRLFVFHRFADSTGFSGTGVAMEGAQFADGRVVLAWLGPYASLVEWPCMEDAIAVHGHGGDTVLAWLDEQPLVR